ncbi:unnamed protein product [Trifolium pratense]|uniref:Uncharacterized protein n=1 Tax=Trifolium pratense TaxID=57577 RepID=A0ACB0KY37_TRIPR|nr:unnamed protein product [Trifolium pratense]
MQTKETNMAKILKIVYALIILVSLILLVNSHNTLRHCETNKDCASDDVCPEDLKRSMCLWKECYCFPQHDN